MSSHSYSEPCPVCDKDMNVCSTNKPFEQTSSECLWCGFSSFITCARIRLVELNDLRADENLPELTREEYNKQSEAVKKFVKDYS